MADKDAGVEGAPDGKKDTGKKGRPRRDKNQPTPKPAKKGGVGALALKALLAGATAIVVLWMGLYSVEVGKGPWAWSGAEWSGFVTFSRKQVDDAREQVEQVDWAALGDKITEKTHQLFDDAPEWEKKLEAKLAQLRGGEGGSSTGPGTGTGAQPVVAGGQAPAAPATPATPTASTASPPATPEAAGKAAPAAPRPPTELELGLEALRDGVAHYRRSMRSQSETRVAKDKFRDAQGHLAAAMEDADRRHDAKAQAEIDDYLRQANTYFEDCKKRETIR